MKKSVLAVILGSVVAMGFAAPKKSSEKVICTITNKTVDECCCVQQKDGKLYCTLAKKTVDPCCCRPADSRLDVPHAKG